MRKLSTSYGGASPCNTLGLQAYRCLRLLGCSAMKDPRLSITPSGAGLAVRRLQRASRDCFQPPARPSGRRVSVAPASKSGTKKQNFGPHNHLNSSQEIVPTAARSSANPGMIQDGFVRRSRRKTFKMAAVYEDNFGFWDIDGEEEQAFLEYVQRQSVPKICDRCERCVRLMPPKTLCASCVTALECGAPTSMSQY
jgi:hypothetical protein